jgi:methionine synthase II (cobalamin-independent)
VFASLAAGYPRSPLPGQPERPGDELWPELLAEQEKAGLAILTETGARWADRVAPIAAGVAGLEAGEPVALPGGELVTRLRVVDGLGRRGPLLVEAWHEAAARTELPVKQTLVGPYTLGRLAELGGRGRRAITIALAEQLNRELRDLAAAGCPIVQIDEGLAAAIGDDREEWRLFAGALAALMDGLEPDAPHLSLGLVGGVIDPAGYDIVFGAPFRSYLVDVVTDPTAWRTVFAVPEERGVILGADDAHRTQPEEVEVLVWAMAWAAAAGRGAERVGIAPSGTLAGLDRHQARRKIERLGESIRIANMGPLEGVADSLDSDPLRSKMPGLRAMAEAVEAASGRGRGA